LRVSKKHSTYRCGARRKCGRLSSRYTTGISNQALFLCIAGCRGFVGFNEPQKMQSSEPLHTHVGAAGEQFLFQPSEIRLTARPSGRTTLPGQEASLKSSPVETARFRTGLTLFFVHLLSEAPIETTSWPIDVRFCNTRL
jgi:hypothetical protein